MTDLASQEQELRHPVSFKEILLQSAFTRGRAIPDSVREIDLGIFGEEGRSLVSKMVRDPRLREFGKLVCVTRGKKVLLQEQPTMGDEMSVTPVFKTDILIDNPALPWFKRQERMCGSVMHTHPEDIPPGSHDLFNLLLGDFDYSAESAVFVASVQRNFVIFRGSTTPHFTHDQADEKIALWERLMQERVNEFTDPFMPRSEQLDINNKARTALLRQIGQKYGLKIFIGDAKSTKVSLLI